MFRKAVLCVAFVVLLSVPAMGRVQTFGPLSVEVPSGWTAERQGSVTVIKNAGENASVSVAVNSKGEATLTDITERLYVQMNGTGLEQDEDGDYTFQFESLAGAESFAIITDSGDGRYILISVTGYKNENVQEALDAIVDSLDWNE